MPCLTSAGGARTLQIAAAVALAFGAAGATAAPNSVRYACGAGQELTVDRSRAIAHVQLAGRSYDLRRKPSSIGDKYISQNTALIIDGTSAVFVAPNHLDLGTCLEAVPIASAR